MINSAGSDAIRLALGAVPMLILSLTIVGLLQGAGAIDLLQQLLKPLLSWLHIPQNFVLPALVKCVAGGTAYFGVISELSQRAAAYYFAGWPRHYDPRPAGSGQSV